MSVVKAEDPTDPSREFVEFWNEILVPKFIRFKHILEQGNIRVDQGFVAWVRRSFKSEAGIETKFDTSPVRVPPRAA